MEEFASSSSNRPFQVYCQSPTEEKQIRKFSPCLEGALLSGNGAVLSDDWKAVPDIWRSSAEKYGDCTAVVDPYHDPPTTMTYKQLEQEILDFAEGLRVIGVKPDEKVAVFAENSCRWLVADQGAMATGAINVVRGSRSSNEELLRIYNHSESAGLIVDNPEFYNRIADTFCSEASVRFVILLWGDKSFLASNGTKDFPVFSYKDIINIGRKGRRAVLDSRKPYVFETISTNDVATIVYTSGTTGNPKGVMLTHKNLLHQIRYLYDIVQTGRGDRCLSMLPPWHAYERAVEYYTFSQGVEHVYTTVKYFKDDLKKYQPQCLISVPLVYETLYNGIQKQILTSSTFRKLIALTLIKVSFAYMDAKRIYEGMYLTNSQKQASYISSMGDLLWARIVASVLLPLHVLAEILVHKKIRSAIGMSKARISGGGSLSSHVDKFYEAIGVKIQNGYGLTETSPVIACRRPDVNVIGSIGHPLRHTEFKIVNTETGETLPPGSRGIVKVRGPQVMKGYYKNPEATKEAIDKAGWLNTGDLGWIAPHHSIGRSRFCGGVIVLEGRAKDTIVLSTGENVEPQELEDAARRSSLIEQIVVVGQDRRRLGAIVVPNKDEVLMTAKTSSIIDSDASHLSNEKTVGLIHEELRKWTSECSFQIGPILLVEEPFTIDSGLMTETMKIRRDRVTAKFKDDIDNLYK
ncbi:probable acyl-activating enzyme 16, chloroplastic [Rutidosis leptorrhynchoides]|uniref:probable acyl-activating enzyme 16, chloroplastic n=1 Tax=Rutidosis leptorrhynchoides TaxID=125765 RepID=UPI003A9A6479